VRTVILRRIAPTQAIPDDEDDSADHLAVVNPRNAVGQRKIRLNPAHLRHRKPEQITHVGVSSRRQ
jgi:hypothetical protein